MRQELGALVLALRDYGPVRAWSEVQVTDCPLLSLTSPGPDVIPILGLRSPGTAQSCEYRLLGQPCPGPPLTCPNLGLASPVPDLPWASPHLVLPFPWPALTWACPLLSLPSPGPALSWASPHQELVGVVSGSRRLWGLEGKGCVRVGECVEGRAGKRDCVGRKIDPDQGPVPIHWWEASWKANTPRCRLTVLELGFLGLERFQSQAPKGFRGLFVSLSPQSFRGACVFEVAGLASLNSRPCARGNVTRFPRTLGRKEREGKRHPKPPPLNMLRDRNVISKSWRRKPALSSMEHGELPESSSAWNRTRIPRGRSRELGPSWTAAPPGSGEADWGPPRLPRAPRPAILCAQAPRREASPSPGPLHTWPPPGTPLDPRGPDPPLPASRRTTRGEEEAPADSAHSNRRPPPPPPAAPSARALPRRLPSSRRPLRLPLLLPAPARALPAEPGGAAGPGCARVPALKRRVPVKGWGRGSRLGQSQGGCRGARRWPDRALGLRRVLPPLCSASVILSSTTLTPASNVLTSPVACSRSLHPYCFSLRPPSRPIGIVAPPPNWSPSPVWAPWIRVERTATCCDRIWDDPFGTYRAF
ncbi:hypothetical protein Cadr_000017071 [Camelus dromedarius]|uniref:Uncharacterized protein n=1 Tax=Camelus dromedarius TaxID=9838 RepID=A0A5N4DH62_CAMDR|nr:hypothetical protein Cadr_000017071 [Camelus dromedarius]